MAVWVALLRGINVGGHRKVPMAELRAACEAAGLEGVRSYIASGNLVFRSSRRSAAAVRDLLGGVIAERFGFEVEVVVRTPAQLERVVKGLPFDDPDHVSVSFLTQALGAAAAADLSRAVVNDARVEAVGDHVYLLTPNGLGKPYLAAGADRRFSAAGTVRNWRTVGTLLEMARDA